MEELLIIVATGEDRPTIDHGGFPVHSGRLVLDGVAGRHRRLPAGV
jgi:hypothetical protein